MSHLLWNRADTGTYFNAIYTMNVLRTEAPGGGGWFRCEGCRDVRRRTGIKKRPKGNKKLFAPPIKTALQHRRTDTSHIVYWYCDGWHCVWELSFSLISFFRLSSSVPAHSFTHILGNAGMDSLIHRLSKPSHPNVIPKFAIYFPKRDTKHLHLFHTRAPPLPLPSPLVIRCHFCFAPTVQNEIFNSE